MRKILTVFTFFLPALALAQQPNGTINAPIYATGYISQVGGTDVTTRIPAQSNHPTNLNIYTTSAITGVWTIKLPNPAFEGQLLTFNCGASVSSIIVTSSDGSALDTSIPITCSAYTGFSIQFDMRDNIWRSIGSSNTAIISAAFTVNNNTQLSAVPTFITGPVVRLGYAAAGDAPSVTYNLSGSACSLNSGAGDGGSQVPASGGKCWIANLPAAADVRIWGAVLNGSTDDAAKANAALLVAKAVVIPAGKELYAASTISVPPGVTLEGADFSAGNYPTPTSSRITCGTTVSPCVQSIGGANGTSGFRNLMITRAGGVPSSSTVGLYIQDNERIVVKNVVSLNHGICYSIKAQVYNTSAGISAFFDNAFSGKCVDAHVVIDSFPEVRWTNSRFGVESDYASNTFVRYKGGTAGTAGGPNTVTFDNVHFGGNGALRFFEFVNLGAGGIAGGIDAREFVFDKIHVGGIASGGSVFYSDSSWDYLDRLSIINSTFQGPSYSLFSLNAGTAVKNWNVQGNRIFGANVTLAPTAAFTGLNFNSNWIQGTISITGAASSYGSFTSNHFYGNTTFAGAWARLSLCGNDVISGTYSVTATGAVARCDPGYTWSTGGQPLTTNAISNSAGVYLAGSTPTCSMASAGTGATCAFSGGSNANVGTVAMTAGTTAAASGTMTVTFSTTFTGTSTPVCRAGYDDTGTAWNAGAIAPKVSAISTSAVTFTWNNNAVALTNGSTYRIMYQCFGK